MDLKDKFSTYQSEPSQEAWEHFQSLKKKEKEKEKRGFFFFFWIGGCLLTSLGLFAFMLNHYSKQDTIASIQNSGKVLIDSVQIIDSIQNSTFSTGTQSKSNKSVFIPTMQKANTGFPTNLTDDALENTDNSVRESSNENGLKNQIVRKDKQLKKVVDSGPVTDKKKSTQLVNLTEKIISTTSPNQEQLLANKEKIKEVGLIENGNALQKKPPILPTIAVLKLEWTPIFPLNKIAPSIPAIATPIIKKYKPPKNTLKITAGYADGFINGFTLAEDQPVDKRGFAIDASYYRNLSKLIGLGLSVGYLKGTDKENPQLAIKDKESVQFLHANLYLFLVHERRHRVYGKIGAGPTRTNRILGTFFVDQTANIIERRFQINTLKSLGISVEGAYEFQVKPKLWIGTNYSIISHNDGGWYVGFSINRKF